jgi:site-specific recombinase XerD
MSFVDVNQHLSGMEAAGAKASTIQRRIASIRGFFEWLIALKLLQANPAHRSVVRRVRRVSMKDRPITVLTADQARSLIDAARYPGEAAPRDHAMINVMLHCVLRRSEVAGMDFEHVRRIGSYWVVDLPATKGGADQFVKIPDRVQEIVAEMASGYGISSGPLWRSLSRNDSRGRRLSPGSVYRIVKRTAERAALSEEIGAHTLRHTGCTLAIESGASIQQVQIHARHKNIETTMTYVHQRDKLRDSAADKIDLG